MNTMTSANGRRIAIRDRVTARPNHTGTCQYGDVEKVGRKWVHVRTETGVLFRALPADLYRA